MRILHELCEHPDGLFVTLTYSPECLPPGGSLVKADLQKFFKRLRRRLEPRKVRYYASGEYGDLFGRPHYHAIVFGVGFSDREVIEDAWRLGRIHVGTVTYDSARYTADYVQKKLYGKKEKQYKDRNLTPPFSLQSLGLGRDYADRNRSDLSVSQSVTCRGEPIGLPRYYRKRLAVDSDQLAQKAKEQAQRVIEHWVPRVGQFGVPAALSAARRQADATSGAREQLYRKGSL